MSLKRERRAERLRVADAEELRRATETPREFSRDIGFRGAGLLHCQIATIPSFVPARCFDVRRDSAGDWSPDGSSPPGRLRLFRAEGTAPGSPLVVGYEELAIPEVVLEGFLHRLAGINVPLSVEAATVGVADGSRLEVAVALSLATLRITWVEDHAPGALAQLELVAKEMRSTFDAAGARR